MNFADGEKIVAKRRRFKLTHIVSVLIAFVLIVSGIFYYYSRETDAPTRVVKDDSFIITGWIPDWGSKDGLESMENNKDFLTSISPVWYEVQHEEVNDVMSSDGSLVSKVPKQAPKIINIAKENDIEVIPAIAMFDHEIFSAVLRNQESLDNHVDSIYNEVIDNGYDGIDLDYESTSAKDKKNYFEFLMKLSVKLHSKDKKLVVTVLPQWGIENYTALPETRSVQDWGLIADYADEIRIMAYDYTFSKSANPGPIAPISWVRDVLDYAVSQAERDKFVLGVHLYSYEWYAQSDNEISSVNENLEFKAKMDENGLGKRRARSYVYDTVANLIDSYQGEVSEYEGEKIFRYTKINNDTNKMEDRVLVYIDNNGIQERIQLAKDYGIKGVAFWRLGGEGDLLSVED